MSKLLIWRAKPNPAGKDKSGEKPKPEQLNGEWAEIKNPSSQTVDLGGVQLDHTLFKDGKPESGSQKYWAGRKGLVLGPDQVLRIHTGHAADRGSMKVEDSSGADIHEFAEHGNFKLNNKEGDILYLCGASPDKASYDPNVREGAVLTRVGDKLVDLQAGGGGGGSTSKWDAPAVVGNSGNAA